MPRKKTIKSRHSSNQCSKKRLLVELSKTVARPEQILPFVAEHLV